MDETDRRLATAIKMTRVVRAPKQHLSTFGVTNLEYYLITTPIYSELVDGSEESVIREGRVISEKPTIVTPQYLLNLEGFSDGARTYMESLMGFYGPNSPGLLYRYRNEPGDLEIIADATTVVAQRISDDLDRRKVDLAAVILGVDDLWDVSLLKFIYEYTNASLESNVGDIQAKGLLDPEPDTNVPRGAIQHIEELFHQVKNGLDPNHLREELSRWHLFERYQDRFLNLFRNKK